MFRRYMALLVLVQAFLAPAQAQTQTPPQAPPPKPSEALATVGAEPQSTSAVFGDWTLRCQRVPDGDKVLKLCEIAGTIRNQNQDAIAQAIVSRALKTEPLKLTAQIPNNVLLPYVVKFTTSDKDAKPWELGLRRVTPIGVFADLPLSEAQVKTLHAQSDPGSLEFTDAAGRLIKLPLSLRGLPQALDALARE